MLGVESLFAAAAAAVVLSIEGTYVALRTAPFVFFLHFPSGRKWKERLGINMKDKTLLLFPPRVGVGICKIGLRLINGKLLSLRHV